MLARRNLKTNKRETGRRLRKTLAGRAHWLFLDKLLFKKDQGGVGGDAVREGNVLDAWQAGNRRRRWSHGNCNTKRKQQETEVQQQRTPICVCDNCGAGEAATDDVFIRQSSQNKIKENKIGKYFAVVFVSMFASLPCDFVAITLSTLAVATPPSARRPPLHAQVHWELAAFFIAAALAALAI